MQPMSKFMSKQPVSSLLLLALGAFSVLGFAPYYFYPATIVSLMALCYCWYISASIRQTAYDGFMYGLGMFGVGIYWIYISLHTFGGMPALMAAFSTLILTAFMALFPAVVGMLSKRFFAGGHVLMAAAIPLLWGLSDWVRSWIFTGFPWLTIGYSQVPSSFLAGYAPVIGIYGVTTLTVLVASLAGLLFVRGHSQSIGRRRVMGVLLILFVAGGLLKQVNWSESVGQPIRVSLLQGNIAQDIKWNPEIANQTIHQYLSMAAQSSAKLIVMPETALPIIASEVPAEIPSQLRQIALRNQGDILVGLIERERHPDLGDTEYYNSVLNFGGDQVAAYRKSHLVPFGEFIPLKVAFGWIYRDWLDMPLSDLSRGEKYQQPMQVAGEKVAVNICYEDVFGEEIIRQLPAATLLVNVSNDAWYGNSYAADQHMQFSQARALETGRMMLRATNTGATAIIDHKGHVVAHAPHFVQTSLDGTAQGYAGTTPYVAWGNWPFVIMSCFGLLILLWRRNTINLLLDCKTK